MLPYFGDSVAGHPSRMLQPWARGLVLVTCSRVKGLVARGTQRFSWLNSWLPREWDFLLRKTLSKFFKSLGLKCFSGWPWRLIGDLFQSRKTRVLRFKDIFLKTFSVFLSNFCDCSLSSPFLSTESNPNTPWHTSQSPFLHHPFSNLQEKGMGFLCLTWFLHFLRTIFFLLSYHYRLRYTVQTCFCLNCWVSVYLVSSLCVFQWVYPAILYIVTILGHY